VCLDSGWVRPHGPVCLEIVECPNCRNPQRRPRP
jgi:hypothetical protein